MFTINVVTTTAVIEVDPEVAGTNKFAQNVVTDVRDRIKDQTPFKITSDEGESWIVFAPHNVVYIRVSGTPDASNDD